MTNLSPRTTFFESPRSAPATATRATAAAKPQSSHSLMVLRKAMATGSGCPGATNSGCHGAAALSLLDLGPWCQ